MPDQFIRPAGSEFHANHEISGPQQRPDIAALSGGGFVTVWESAPFDDTLTEGVYARIHAADGTPVSDDILVGEAGDFARASAGALDDGSFVVSWVRSNPVPGAPETASRDIMARHFSADGTALTDGFVVAQQSVPQINDDGSRYVSEDHPHVTGLPDGGFVISWQGNSEWVPDQQTSFGLGAFTDSVDARFYNADATPRGDSVRLNEDDMFDQQYPEIAPLSDGNIVAVWDGPGDIDARIFTADGTPVTGDFQVNTYTEDSQSFSVSGGDGSVAALNDGGFVVVWQSEEQDDDAGDASNEWGVYGQRFANDGTRVGEEFRVNTTVAGNQEYPVVAATPDGGFMVAWYDNVGDDEVVAQLFGADGAPLGEELYVEDLPDSITLGTHWRPTVDTLESGDIALAWEFESNSILSPESSDGIYGRVLQTSPAGFSDPVLADLPQDLTVAEGTSGPVLVAQAMDADGDTVTYSLAGTDADAFTIEAASGAVRFVTPPDFEDPADDDADNVHDIEIVAEDGFGGSDRQALEVTVEDEDDLSGTIFTPESTPLAGAAVTFDAIETTSDASGAFAFDLLDGAAGRLEATRPYTDGDPAISVSDALDVLRLAVGLDPSWGPAEGIDFVAADINQDGRVSVSDALDTLRAAVGLESEAEPRWIGYDAESDFSGQSAQSVDVAPGVEIPPVTEPQTADMTAILLGNMQDAVG